MEFSLTIGGLLSFLIVMFLEENGTSVGLPEVNNFVFIAGKVITLSLTYFGRFRKGDIRWWGARKKKQVQ